MQDIADKVDRIKDLIAHRHGEGKRYDRTIEEEQISLDFFGEVVANSRRIAVALERIADAVSLPGPDKGQLNLAEVVSAIEMNTRNS